MIDFLFRSSPLIGVATIVLMIGEATPNERMIFFGLPLNTVIVAGLALYSLVIATSLQAVRFAGMAFLCIVVSILYGLTLSGFSDYGLYKSLNLILASLPVIIVFHHYYTRGQQDQLWTLVILIMLAYLIAAIFYKLQNGFWDRQTLFLMNGPIVFGRLMSMAAILSLLFLRGPQRLVAFTLCLAAVFWSSSKGPLVALLLVICLYMVAQRRLIVLSVFAAVASVFVILAPDLVLDFVRLVDGTKRIAIVAESLLSGVQIPDVYTVSFTARLGAYFETIKLIMQYPMGIGLGEWQTYAKEPIEYPHNFFLEVFAEFGLVFGSLFMIPYLYPLVMAQNQLRWVTLLFAFNQQVSGDILDSRYWLIFGILSCLPVQERAPKTATISVRLDPKPIQGTNIVYGHRKRS